MTKSQNTKNEQQKDLCITSEQLTEQWKKGKLPSGWYWVELKEGTFVDGKKSIILDYLFEFTNDFERHPYLVEQVLAPVPSYDEWQAKLEENKRLKHDVGNLGYKIKNQRKEIERQIAQNAQLKERNDSLNNRDINLCRIANGIRDENFALKELLKECELWFTGIVGNMNDKNVGEHNRSVPIGNFEYIFKVFSQKINEVLK